MILKLGMKHLGMKLYKVWQGQLRSPMHFNGKNRKMSCNGRKLARNEQMDRRFMLIKIFQSQGLSAPASELYTCR